MGLEMVAVALAAPPLLNREEESERGNGLCLGSGLSAWTLFCLDLVGVIGVSRHFNLMVEMKTLEIG